MPAIGNIIDEHRNIPKIFPFHSVHPAGLEPATTVPKTGMISISLRVHFQWFLSYAKLVKTQKLYYNCRMKKAHDSKDFAIPAEVAEVAATLEKKGFQAYLIGGCVRD